MLLVKLRKAEARSASLAEEVSVLRAAVDSQSGTWFEDIHANVQRVTREGMQRADTLQVRSCAVRCARCYISVACFWCRHWNMCFSAAAFLRSVMIP